MLNIHVFVVSGDEQHRKELCRSRIAAQLCEGDRITELAVAEAESASLNSALNNSDCDICLFIESGVFVPPGFLDAWRKAFSDDAVMLSTCPYVIYTGFAERMNSVIGTNLDALSDELDADSEAWKKYGNIFQLRGAPYDPVTNELIGTVLDLTAICAVRRNAVERCGGFDDRYCLRMTRFADLAMRLRSSGSLISIDAGTPFVDARRHAFMGEGITLERDIRQLLGKYPSNRLELELAFFSADPNRALPEFERLCLCLSGVKCDIPDIKYGELYCLLASDRQPRGQVVFKDNGELRSYELFGLRLPFEAGTFNAAVLSPGWALLPERLLAMLLQELLRVSDCVKLDRSIPDAPPFPNGDAFTLYYPMFFDRLIVEHIGVFDFTERDDRYIYAKWAKGARIMLEKPICSI